MGKRMLFVINPNAGKGRIKNHLFSIVNLFSTAGYEVTVYPTKKPGDGERVVRERAAGYDLLVCAGGDGTLSEVAQGLMEIETRPPVGYIPAGTTNDFASSLKLPKNMLKAASAAVCGEPFPCDIGSFNDTYFTYVAAFGAFTDVPYATSQQFKNILGHLAYLLEGMKRLPTIRSFALHIEHDGEVVDDRFMFGMITNSTSTGGFKGLTGKGVKLDDGLFEASFIKMPNNLLDLQTIITALLRQEVNPKWICSFRTSRLQILSDKELPWTIDGEFGGAVQEVTIQNHRQAITIYRPAKS